MSYPISLQFIPNAPPGLFARLSLIAFIVGGVLPGVFAVQADPPSAVVPAAEAAAEKPPQATGPESIFWRVGMTVEPTESPIRKGTAVIPIPGEWPEQFVRIQEETATPGLSYQEQDIETGLRALVVDIPAIGLGEKAELTVVYEVLLTPIAKPDRPRYFKKPEPLDRELTRYVGASPLIDPRSTAIRKLAKELVADKPNDWERIESLWAWTLDNIELSADQPVGSIKVLENKKGCREDRVNLFVALCRNQRYPARIVWADHNEYAEFYLLDEAGKGAWYPCLFSGPREFGYLTHPVVVEQKGDNFQPPGSREKKRFVNATASVTATRPGQNQTQRPNLLFDRRPIPESMLQKNQGGK